MKPFPYEKLSRIQDFRLEVALNAVRDKQAVAKIHNDRCAAIQQQLTALHRERQYQQQLASGNRGKLPATLLAQQERVIHMNTQHQQRTRDELEVARLAQKEASTAVAVELTKYHRARTKRNQLREREKTWKRAQLRSMDGHADDELSEFALAQVQCTAPR